MRIASLHTYPIKSCQGINLQVGTFGRRGFELDRRFMVVNERGGFRSQREDPALARVEVQVEGRTMTVSTHGHGAVAIDLDEAAVGDALDVTVWRNTSRGIDQGDDAAVFFSELLGAPSRLVHMPDDVERHVTRKLATSRDDIVGYADSSPVLVTSVESLADLQRHMDERVPMGRFRPNIVLSGGAPWEEDRWTALHSGDVELSVTKACKRCVITTTDQATGKRASEPMRTLGRLRRSETGSGVEFGMYAVPRTPAGELAVGDEVEALDG